jgi:hypothetical protein
MLAAVSEEIRKYEVEFNKKVDIIKNDLEKYYNRIKELDKKNFEEENLKKIGEKIDMFRSRNEAALTNIYCKLEKIEEMLEKIIKSKG